MSLGRVTRGSATEVIRLKPLDEILERYLAMAPLAHAMFRAVELRPLQNAILERPVLDVGCGAGEFARAALDQPLDVGIDVSASRLARARATKLYRRLDQASACDMPYDDDTFRTVISISVFEHIGQPDALVSEIFRVLQPGGVLLATVVLSDLHEHLLCPRLFGRLGMPLLERRLLTACGAVFRHVSLLSQEEWDKLLVEAGFHAIETEKVVSARVVRWWELLLSTAWPYRLSGIVGRPWIWRPRWLCRTLRRRFQGLVQTDTNGTGGCLFVRAAKPQREAATISDLERFFS